MQERYGAAAKFLHLFIKYTMKTWPIIFIYFFFRRASFFACCLDKHLYVIGGRNETGYLSSVEAYNLETNEWNYVSSLPQPLAAHAGAVHNGKIYISGESVIKPSQDSFVPLTSRIWKKFQVGG